MAETDEETLSRRALQVAKNMKYVVRVEPESGRETVRAHAKRELLLDPSPLLIIEAGELFLECRIADHAVILSLRVRVRRCEHETAGSPRAAAKKEVSRFDRPRFRPRPGPPVRSS